MNFSIRVPPPKWWVATVLPGTPCASSYAVQETAASLQCMQPLVAVRKDRDAKAELNRRSQACDIS